MLDLGFIYNFNNNIRSGVYIQLYLILTMSKKELDKGRGDYLGFEGWYVWGRHIRGLMEDKVHLVRFVLQI